MIQELCSYMSSAVLSAAYYSVNIILVILKGMLNYFNRKTILTGVQIENYEVRLVYYFS